VAEPILPAYARESIAVRLDRAVTLEDLTPAWAWGGATGAGVRVAVIDSGIDADHPALEGCVEVDKGVVVTLEADGEATAALQPHGDVFGHGTACAGIIHSIAPEARITSIRVLDQRLSGKSVTFLRGLAWAVDNGFDVVNLSLGTAKRDWALAFYELCDAAYFRNTVLVTAANNLLRPSFPNLYASVISVACNLAKDPFRFHYNPDPPTEFLAPGVDIDVAWLGGSTMKGTGNSYAAPHITGIAALIRSKHPDLKPFQLKTVLWATAKNVRDALPGEVRPATMAVRRMPTRASVALRHGDLPSI